MRTGINLATPVKANRNKRIFFLVSLGIFGVSFVVAMILLLFSILLNGKYNSLADKKQSLAFTLNQESQKKVEYATVRERLFSIAKIINTRKNINTHLVSVINLFPQPIKITNFTVTDTSVSLAATSQDLSSLKNVLENAIPDYSKEPSSGISKVQQSSLQFDPDSLTYTVSLDFTFNK